MLLTGAFGLGVLISLMLWRPNFLLAGIIESALANQGYRLEDLGSLSIGRTQSKFSNLTLSDESLRLEITGLTFNYELSELYSGMLRSVQIEALAIDAILVEGSVSDAQEQERPTLFSAIGTIEQLPVESVQIERMTYTGGSTSGSVTLELSTNPLLATVKSLDMIEYPEGILASIERVDDHNLAASLSFTDEVAEVFSIQVNVLDLGTSLLVTGDSIIALESLVRYPQFAEAIPDIRLESNRLNVKSSMTLQADLADANEFEVTLDSASSIVEVQYQSDAGLIDSRVHLPLSFSGSFSEADGNLTLNSSVLHSSGDWLADDAKFDYLTTLESVAMHCDLKDVQLLNCRADSFLTVSLPNWSVTIGPGNELTGSDFSLQGASTFSYLNEALNVSSPELLFSLPSLTSSYGASKFTGEITELEGVIDETLRGSLRFRSTELDPGFENFSVDSPSVSGRFELEPDTVTAVVEVGLADQFKLGAAAQHYFSRNTGNINIQLAPLQFGIETPLSGLIEQQAYNVDLEAGTITGRADVSWSLDQNQVWQVGGPVSVDFAELSGFYENTLFLGFNSQVSAEVINPIGLRSLNNLSATLDSVDPGLPLRNLSWDYRFDTTLQEFSLANFEIELLGGRLQIPFFTYQLAQPRQQMDVILSDLNMIEIVALANYPNVAIDGRVSGYLPLVIEGETVTVEDGLVGALNPGGTIRYTPASATPSSNSSIQLVNEALSNYQYQLLDTQVDYAENGDLEMAVQLQGRNPDMNGGQAINLNVNVTDNIPTLLKSLQAGRSISDELERQIQLRQNR